MPIRVAAFLWLLFVVIFSLLPSTQVGDTLTIIPHVDKLFHLSSYFLMVYLWASVFVQRLDKVKAARIAFYASIVIGVLLEILQNLLAMGRDFDIFDIIANTFGSILGLVFFYKLNKP